MSERERTGEGGRGEMERECTWERELVGKRGKRSLGGGMTMEVVCGTERRKKVAGGV